MKTARVCFLWHMHQPYSTDLAAGFAGMACLRLQALQPSLCRPS